MTHILKKICANLLHFVPHAQVAMSHCVSHTVELNRFIVLLVGCFSFYLDFPINHWMTPKGNPFL